MWKWLLLVVVVGWGAYSTWAARAVSHAPGVIAPHVPMQSAVGDAQPFAYKGYRIIPLARFSAEARVLHRENYHLGRESELSPVDLALGWGRMSDESVLQQFEIGQSNRFFYLRWTTLPIPQGEMETSAANMHLIPADGSVESALKRVRTGQVVRFSGYLVRVEASDGWQWISSLTREDTGAGSCELVWVEDLSAI